MSELVPFFDDDEQLDDNLLRSIETLLDDNEHHGFDGMKRGKAGNGIGGGMSPSSPLPQFEAALNGSSFAFGNQVYQKWSNNDQSNEVMQQQVHAINEPMKRPNHHGARNQQSRSSASHFMKTTKKNVQPSPNVMASASPNTFANFQIAQCQAILAERAHQLLNQYMQLNYESLNAQAQILGLPLDQYIRNLLVALNTPIMMPQAPSSPSPNQPSFLFSPPPTPTSPMPNAAVPNAAQQRAAFAKQYFNKKN